jgi:alpha-ketoglutaric semialdehyde dehydrogenase
VIGESAHASAADAERAILAARAAFPGWSRSGIQQRHDILKRIGDEILARKDELGRLLSDEVIARAGLPAFAQSMAGTNSAMSGGE